jgi:hypothetical protein
MPVLKGKLTYFEDLNGFTKYFSYDELIAVEKNGEAIINCTRYSATTSKHVGIIKKQCPNHLLIDNIDDFNETAENFQHR